MIKIVNKILSLLKIVLLLISFILTFFIVMKMYERLEKNYVGTISVFLPYLTLFIAFAINLILRQKQVNDNMFYNVTCCLVFIVLIFCGYRALTDDFMIFYIRLGYQINFNFYSDMIAPMRVMLYLLTISNVLLMLDRPWKRFEKEIVSVVPDKGEFPDVAQPIPVGKEV